MFFQTCVYFFQLLASTFKAKVKGSYKDMPRKFVCSYYVQKVTRLSHKTQLQDLQLLISQILSAYYFSCSNQLEMLELAELIFTNLHMTNTKKTKVYISVMVLELGHNNTQNSKTTELKLILRGKLCTGPAQSLRQKDHKSRYHVLQEY